MPLKLYMFNGSPPCRSVLLTAAALELEIERKIVDTRIGEQPKPEFIKLNPQHTVPTLDDDSYVLWDSHAINAYLVRKYAKDDALYPKKDEIRGTVDQRLHFDTGAMINAMKEAVLPLVKQGLKEVPEEALKVVNETYGFLNTFLEKTKWIAADQLTIADFSIFTSLTTLELYVPVDTEKHPNVIRWMEQVKNLPYYDEFGLDNYRAFAATLLKK